MDADRRDRWLVGVDALATATSALLFGADAEEVRLLLRAVEWPELSGSEVADSATGILVPLMRRLAKAEGWTTRQAIEWARSAGRAEVSASCAIDQEG